MPEIRPQNHTTFAPLLNPPTALPKSDNSPRKKPLAETRRSRLYKRLIPHNPLLYVSPAGETLKSIPRGAKLGCDYRVTFNNFTQ